MSMKQITITNQNINVRSTEPVNYRLEWLIANLKPTTNKSSLIRDLIVEKYESAGGPPLPPELDDTIVLTFSGEGLS